MKTYANAKELRLFSQTDSLLPISSGKNNFPKRSRRNSNPCPLKKASILVYALFNLFDFALA
ncbi:MAG: hypothetical protein ACFNX0_02185 [Treponema sp.]